jgi:hypothetical protein
MAARTGFQKLNGNNIQMPKSTCKDPFSRQADEFALIFAVTLRQSILQIRSYYSLIQKIQTYYRRNNTPFGKDFAPLNPQFFRFFLTVTTICAEWSG